MTSPRYLTEEEAMRIGRFSRTTAWRYRKKRLIPFLTLPGGGIRYPEKEFLTWLEGLRKDD